MRRAKLLAAVPCRCPEEIKKTVEGVSQICSIDGKEILNIDIYSFTGELVARYFADREEEQYTAYVNGEWKTCSLNNVERLSKGEGVITGWCWDPDICFADKESEKRCAEYLGTYSVDRWECHIRSDRTTRARIRKRDRVQAMMDEVDLVPPAMEAWIQNEIFPENYLFFRRQGKRFYYSCTACGAKSWQKKKLSHNHVSICPKCGRELQAKSRTHQINRKENVTLLQDFRQDEWIERKFRAIGTWEGNEKRIDLLEDIRAIIHKPGTWGKVWYGQLHEADECEQEWWDSNPINKRFGTGYLYPGNVQEVLRGGPLGNSGLNLLAEQRQRLEVNNFIIKYSSQPYLEYVIKMGLTNLAADMTNHYWNLGAYINVHAETGKELLKLDGNHLNRLRQMNGGFVAMKWLQYEMKSGSRISAESLEWLQLKDISPGDVQEILKELKSVNRMVNYLRKQRIAPKNVITIWRDYLRMAQEEGMDVGDDIVRLPKDLKARHDELVEIRNARADRVRIQAEKRKYARLDKGIRNMAYKRYCYETEEYIIRSAANCEEIMQEGRALHHCVGSHDHYMENMSKGVKAILFLRRKNNPDKPYYTIEIDVLTNKVLQCRSEYNRQPDYNSTISKVVTAMIRNLKREKVEITA